MWNYEIANKKQCYFGVCRKKALNASSKHKARTRERERERGKTRCHFFDSYHTPHYTLYYNLLACNITLPHSNIYILYLFILTLYPHSHSPTPLHSKHVNSKLVFFCWRVVFSFCSLVVSRQATMLKKNKFKRRPTEPSILPANGEGGKSTDD